MYEKKKNLNLFPTLDVSEDAQRLLSSWVVGSVGASMARSGARMSNRVIGTAVGATGFGAVIIAANEAVDVVIGINPLAAVGSVIGEGVAMLKAAAAEQHERFEETRANAQQIIDEHTDAE